MEYNGGILQTCSFLPTCIGKLRNSHTSIPGISYVMFKIIHKGVVLKNNQLLELLKEHRSIYSQSLVKVNKTPLSYHACLLSLTIIWWFILLREVSASRILYVNRNKLFCPSEAVREGKRREINAGNTNYAL